MPSFQKMLWATIGITVSTVVIAAVVLSAPAVQRCSDAEEGVWACLRDEVVSYGLLPDEPALTEAGTPPAAADAAPAADPAPPPQELATPAEPAPAEPRSEAAAPASAPAAVADVATPSGPPPASDLGSSAPDEAAPTVAANATETPRVAEAEPAATAAPEPRPIEPWALPVAPIIPSIPAIDWPETVATVASGQPDAALLPETASPPTAPAEEESSMAASVPDTSGAPPVVEVATRPEDVPPRAVPAPAQTWSIPALPRRPVLALPAWPEPPPAAPAPVLSATAAGGAGSATWLVAPEIDAVEIDDGTAFVAGAGPEGAEIELFVGDRYVGSATVDGGRWLVETSANITASNAPLTVAVTSGIAAGTEAALVFEAAPKGVRLVSNDVASRAVGQDPEAAAPVDLLRPIAAADPEMLRFRSGKAIIRRGDTLWAIARRVYGRGIEYRRIVEANREQISRPGRIYPGQVFELPQME